MRYYLDSEFNGNGGQLLSIALVRADGAEFYEVLHAHELIVPWVKANVMPVLERQPIDRATVVKKLQKFLRKDPGPHSFIADWPEDIAHFCRLLVRNHGKRNDPLRFRCLLLDLPGFDTAHASAAPHNALSDARSLRDHVEAGLAPGGEGLSPEDLALLHGS
ncbi:hypothetical protein ACQKOH_00405 [Sphingomonas sp. NPDC092331]|jgi:3' exoribonuclease, RNase T-like|uniref:hypothetical protein n=1 Tax=unclassified Sphingomonas TaxID=196159 RepID=UPI0031F48BB6